LDHEIYAFVDLSILALGTEESPLFGGVRNAATRAFSMNPQNTAAQLLHKIVRGVIPQSAKEQGMPV
jgi:hypothetical protein